jgi:hypothetical protein
MARWSAGWPWMPDAEGGPTGEPSLWESVDASVGWPDVLLRGVNVCDRVTAVRWSHGRDWWLSAPEPGTASLELSGTLAGTELADLQLGDPVMIAAAPAGELWHGTVDSIAEHLEPRDGDVEHVVRISAVDQLSRVLTAEVYASTVLTAGTLETRLLAMAQLAGVTTRPVRIAPSVGDLPQLAAVTLTATASQPATFSEQLQRAELASNAIVAVGLDGAWLILPRDRLPETPRVVDLVGDSCPSSADIATASPERVRNAFTIAGAAEQVRQASIERYGRRAFDVPAGVCAAGVTPPYSSQMLDALADPQPFVRVTVPVAARSADAVPLEVFGFVRLPGRPELYQLLGLEWTATPDEWTARLELDRTQSSIAAPPDPETPPVDPPKPPATTATVTETYTCDRSAYVVKTPGGLYAGNGGSVDLLTGLLGDGNLARGLVRFAIGWNGKVRTVKSAKLRLRVGQTTCSAYGSSPRITAYRITGAWSEGTYSTRCGFASSNSVKWPGPATTSTGAASANASRSEGSLVELDVTAAVAAIAAGAPNYGFMIRGASETNSANRVPLWSRHASSSSDRPTLVVTYEYEVP